jgi:type VI secretion system protein ImpF
MARIRGEGPVTVSILDRLLDDDPKRSEEAMPTRAQSLRNLKIGLRRDLEWLLNTRQPVEIPTSLELQKSVYLYGLPDISSLGLANLSDRERLTHAIELAVARFEPRLANVRVSLTSTSGEKAPQLRFAIEGMLRIDPRPEHVTFDTLLELSSREYIVQGEAGAR